jgi:hypothetical protein
VTDKKNETAPNGGPIQNETHNKDLNTPDVTLDTVLSSLSEVKKVKGGYTALCPFHDDHNPSLMVFENGGFYCRACQEKGTLYYLARHLGIAGASDKAQKHSLNAFREYLSKRLGIDPQDVEKVAPRLNIRAKNNALAFSIVSPSGGFIAYVTHKPGDNVKYRLPEGANLKGNLYGLDVALNAIKINYLEESIKGIKGNILLCEGYFDALGCLAHGIPAAATMGGLNGSEEAIRKIYSNLLEAGISRVVLCFDSDNAGRKFTLDYMKYFLSRPGIWTDVILLPEEYKDINEGLQQEGEAYFTKLELYKLEPVHAFIELERLEEEIEKGGFERHIALMKVARFFSEMHPVHREKINENALIERLGTSENEWNALFEELPIEREKERIKNELAREGRIFLEKVEDDPVGAFQRLKDRGELSVRSLEKRKPVSVAEELLEILKEIQHEGDGHRLHDATGIDNIVIQPVDLVTIAAGTGIGKTTFALNVADYFLRDKKRVLFVSYEINRGRLLSQLVAIRTNKKKSDVYRGLKKGAKVDLETVEGLSIIADPAFTVEELTRLVGKFQEERPLDLIIVDYDQLAQTEGRFDNEERRVSFISQTLKGITLDYGVPVILLSQISKEGLLRFSRQKEFDSSIVLKLEPPLKKDNKGKKREMTDNELKEYYEESKREVIVLVDKYRDGQAKREYSIMIDFETGRIPSKSEYDPISNPDPKEFKLR